MIVYLFFVLQSLLAVMLAPVSFDRPFLVTEMVVFLFVGILFLQHKIKMNGLLCFDAFFIPTFFLINYAHAVFVYPDDAFLAAFLYATNTDIIPYAVSVAQVGIAFYMLANIFFEKQYEEKAKPVRFETPKMLVNRIAYLCVVLSMGVFVFVIILRRADDHFHIYPRLMSMILTLISMSWLYQAQLLGEEERGLRPFFYRNKLNLLSTTIFTISMLFLGGRSEVLFMVFMIALIVNTYYFKIKLKFLLPAVLVGGLLMGILMITRVSDFSLVQVSPMESLKYGWQTLVEAPNILWLLLTDFLVNAKTLYDGVDYVHVYGPLYGVSYIQYLFVFVPGGGSFFTRVFTGLDMNEVRTGNILSDNVDASFGLGTNLIGDLYMNFSFIGVPVLMFLLGFVVTRLEHPSSKFRLFAYMALFANCIYLVRADIFSWLTFFVFFLIFDWLLRIHIVYDEDITD